MALTSPPDAPSPPDVPPRGLAALKHLVLDDEGGSAAVEFIVLVPVYIVLLAGLFSMQQGALMPTAGTYDERELMPEVGKLHAVIKAPAEGRIDALQVNAFGFGGQNSSLVVTRE